MDNREIYEGCLLPVIDDNLNIFIENSFYDLNDENPHLIKKVENKDSLYQTFSNIIGYEMYYSFSEASYDDDKIEKYHTDSFENVIRELYFHPKSFSLSKDDLSCYSKQQLLFLNRLKRFLNIANLDDLKDYTKEEIIDRVKTEDVRELMECKLVNVSYGREIVSGKIKNNISRYIDFKFKASEKLLISTLNEDFIGIVQADRIVMKLDEITPDMVDYSLMGFETFEDFKEDFINKTNASMFKLDEEMNVVYETYEVVKVIN